MELARIETLASPLKYSRKQIEQACVIATTLNRGKFVLCVAPECKDEKR